MALHAHDALTPVGRLNAAALWPGVSLDEVSEFIEEYLAQGYANAAVAPAGNQDEAARQWAYYRAWDEKYQALSALPSTVGVGDEGHSSYSQAQINAWRDLAAGALAAFQGLVPVNQPLFPTVRLSRAMDADFVW